MSKSFIHTKHLLNKIKSKLWFKPFSYCFLAILSISLCYFIQTLGITTYTKIITEDTVTSLLSIITNSMLTVVVFSVGAIISAYTSASNSSTPRTLSLLLKDSISQKVTSRFIGAFIFAVIATIGIKSEVFNQNGILLIFILTVGIFCWVIVTFIIWIDSIAKLGQVKTILVRIENQCYSAIDKYLNNYDKCCHKLIESQIPNGLRPIYANSYGFIVDINLKKINKICEQNNSEIFIIKNKGSHLTDLDIVAFIDNKIPINDEDFNDISNSFIFDDNKKFEDNPIFCINTLGEMAAKALSPGINDPGTAIETADAINRSISYLIKNDKKDYEILYDKIYLYHTPLEYIAKCGFEKMRIYGSDNLYVCQKIQQSLIYISKLSIENNDKKAILEYANNCYKQAHKTLSQDFEKDELEKYRKIIS